MKSCDRFCVAVVFLGWLCAGCVLPGLRADGGGGVPVAHTVKKHTFKGEITLKGVFEARDTAEIAIEPKAWNQWRLVRVAGEGTAVKKGAELMRFETLRIDRAIEDAEAGVKLAELGLKQLEQDIAAFEKALPLDLAAAKRKDKRAAEDLKRFTEVDQPLAVKSTKRSAQSAQHHLEYQQEELRQLEKMYKNDEVTEETEEIILKRQRRAVENAAFWLEVNKAQVERSLKLGLPRLGEDKRESATRSALALARARGDLPRTLRKMQLELAKKKHDRVKSDRNLRELKEDREAMIVRAPSDGIVYYGRCVRGVWARPDPITAAKGQGGVVKPRMILMTLVRPRPLSVRATLSEKSLRHVPMRSKARVAPTAAPDRRLDATVDEISNVPVAPGKFAVRLAVAPAKSEGWVRAGMSCTVKVKPARPTQAPAVPSKAVFTDPADKAKRCVYVRKADGAAEKRRVSVGRTADGMTEIQQGVKEGEVILLKAPRGGK